MRGIGASQDFEMDDRFSIAGARVCNSPPKLTKFYDAKQALFMQVLFKDARHGGLDYIMRAALGQGTD
eukprot:584287-Karenia_brevis.AAC.1